MLIEGYDDYSSHSETWQSTNLMLQSLLIWYISLNALTVSSLAKLCKSYRKLVSTAKEDIHIWCVGNLYICWRCDGYYASGKKQNFTLSYLLLGSIPSSELVPYLILQVFYRVSGFFEHLH